MPSTFPRSETEMVVWFNDFTIGFATHYTTLGFNAASLTAVQNDYTAYAYMVLMAQLSKTAQQQITNYKDTLFNGPTDLQTQAYPAPTWPAAPATTVAPGILIRLRALIRRIKAHPNYTPQIGADLGLVGQPNPSAPVTSPSAKAISLPNSQVRIEYKKGRSNGVLIESRRDTETAWTSLGIDNNSPFVDTRAPLVAGKPETREYRLRYVVSDVPVGDYGDVLVAVTKP